ncbi:2-isopropylmalate synthase [Candidatus Woesearchaeota archaeon]|nr:2-isopropylmalate synthase [Candidatus Woesearchaeota archaeon]
MKKIKILDTTLRDGEQTSDVSFKVDEKLIITKYLLEDVKVDAVEVASARTSEGEFEAAKKICNWAKTNNFLDKIEFLGFVDLKKSADWIKDSGGKRMNLLCKGSLEHLTKQLKKTPEKHIEDINKTIKYAEEKGIKVNVYLEDVSNGLKNSKDYVFQLLDNLKGFERVMLPDTLGVWSPEETYNYCREIINKYNYIFDFHAHNDYGLAVANSLYAIKAGVKRIHTTVNGLGERAGNCPLSNIVAALNDFGDYKLNVVEKNLNELSRLVETISGVKVSSNMPVVGKNVYTQTCGVHADGDKKGNIYYNKILPERFGGQRQYALGKTSGKANIQKNLEQLGIKLDQNTLEKVVKKVVELGDKKQKITNSDLPYIVADILGTPLRHKVEIIDFDLHLNPKKQPYARVKLKINNQTYEESANGDGQYDAFMKAVQKIYSKIDKSLPDLVDYSVSIPPGGMTDALVETAITWEKGERFKTRGVDSDQTNAAIKATINMLNIVN